MTEPRIVTPQEAQEALLLRGSGVNNLNAYEVLHTVATEPDRTRAAVVKALRIVQREGIRAAGRAGSMADAIENGADYA